MIDRVNDRIGNYQLIQLLGQGSFADVYLGQHLYLDRQAAIKMQHPLSLSQDHQAFLTEARTIDLAHIW